MKKNILKLFSLLLIASTSFSCYESENDTGNSLDEIGWVEILDNETVTVYKGEAGTIDVEVNIQVPTTSSDLTISYDLVSVSGTDPSSVFSNTGKVTAPAGKTSYTGPSNKTGKEFLYLSEIELNLEELATATLADGSMVFDVVLTGTSSSKVTVGLEGTDIPISKRIIVKDISAAVGIYDIDEVFTDGPNAGLSLETAFGETYQVELSLIPDNDSLTGFNPKTLLATDTAGSNMWFLPGTTLTFNSDDTVLVDDTYNPGIPYLAGFSYHFIDAAVYNDTAGTITANGDFGYPTNYGPYQWIMTKQ